MVNSELEKIATNHGDRLKLISVEFLNKIEGIIKNFAAREKLNNFQNWIVNNMYRYELPEEDFKINTKILIAVHHPFYARVNFYNDGKKRTFLCLVRSDFAEVEQYLRGFLQQRGYSIKKAKNLPLKRLATHSGLAKYGRNNITYIDGLGSNFSYAAYFSDLKSAEESWGEAEITPYCNQCNLCMESCPTKAIRQDRFLIDTQKCLSYINELPGEFPSWLPETVHHTLYDCMKCQQVCPMNNKQLSYIVENISFNEEETNMLLAGKSLDTFSDEFKEKIYLLGIDDWYEAIPRNIATLLKISK